MDIRRSFVPRTRKFCYFNKKTRKFINPHSKLATHIGSLRIPPAYQNVMISKNPSSKVQAIGIDTKGRKQYIYSNEHKERQTELKFRDLIYFGRKIKAIRRDVMNTINTCTTLDKLLSKECLIAIIIFLVDKCNFRIGNEKYKDLYNSYGATTLNSDHIKVENGRIKIQFTGKKGVENSSIVYNRTIVSLLKTLKSVNENREYLFTYRIPGSNEFTRITEKHINQFLKGYHNTISVKMFRTWCANHTLLRGLLRLPLPKDEKKAKANINLIIRNCASEMHHTSNVSKSCYMNSEIINIYLQNPEIFYRIVSQFRKSNGKLPSVDRLLNLFLNYLRSTK